MRTNHSTAHQKEYPAMCIQHPSGPRPRLVDGPTADSILSARTAQAEERVQALTYFLSVVTDVDFQTAGPEVHAKYVDVARRALAELTKAPNL